MCPMRTECTFAVYFLVSYLSFHVILYEVVHGDLKPENLLLSSWDNEKAELKVVDFGCSLILDKQHKEGGGEGSSFSTLAYDSPERLIKGSSPSPPTLESDVWATGCILYILLTGSHPFDKTGCSTDEEIAETVKSIGTDEVKLLELVFDERTNGLSQSSINLLQRLLQPDPRKRITSEQILRNRWVQGLTASWSVIDGIDSKLELYWKKEFQRKILNKFGSMSTDDESLRSVFAQIDDDRSGTIDFEELTKVLKELGTKPNDIVSIFDAINLDHKDDISFQTFRSIMRGEASGKYYRSKFRTILESALKEEQNTDEISATYKSAARRLFNSMDLDQNGSLDCHELRVLLRKLAVPEEEIADLVASVDLDKDGSLDFDEFCKAMHIQTARN